METCAGVETCKTIVCFRVSTNFNIIVKQADLYEAKVMVGCCLFEQGDCLSELGLLKSAEEKYRQAVESAKSIDNKRNQGIGIGLIQLATIYSYSSKYKEAIEGYRQALEVFNSLREQKNQARVHVKIALIYNKLSDYENAEISLQQSLRVSTLNDYIVEKWTSLIELGNLYRQQELYLQL